MEITIGDRIRGLREDCNMTQTALGKVLNMTQRKISYMENNKYEPSIGDIIELCKFFGISSDYLLGITDVNKK